jgi:hypothetical protein
MAVAFDAATENAAAADPQNFTHTPSGTPRGVLVYISHNTVGSDIVNGVTYGGVAMAEAGFADDDTGELGACQVWFLGSSIPTGAQTVSIDRTESTTSVWAVAITVTAAADTEIIDTDTTQQGDANIANPAVTMNHGARSALAFFGGMNGVNAPGSITDAAGQTRIHDHDFGATSGVVSRKDSAGTGDTTMGFTIATNSLAMIGVSVAEVVGGITVEPGVGAVTLAGFAPTVGLPVTVSPGKGDIVIAGFAPTIDFTAAGITISPGRGEITITGFAPTIGLPITVTPGVGEVTIAGFAPTLPTIVAPGRGEITIQGYAPTIGLPVTVRPGVGSVVISGFAPTLPRVVAPGVGAVSITGFAPTIGLPVTVSPGLGAVTITGFAPTLSFVGEEIGWVEFDLYLDVSVAGTFAFRWAQDTSNAAQLAVKAGSYLEYARL